jgi:hypothetical protein
MSKLENDITIKLSAYDMLNMLAMAECTFMIAGFPTPEIQESFTNFKMQIFKNCSDEGLDEALATMRVNAMMYDINNNRKN